MFQQKYLFISRIGVDLNDSDLDSSSDDDDDEVTPPKKCKPVVAVN
jgi:hypothetical protein